MPGSRGNSAPSGRVVEQISVDASDTGNHSVCRTLLDQFGQRTPTTLGRDSQPAVLDERAGVTKVVHVFTSGPLALRMPSGDGRWPSRIEGHRVPVEHFA